MQQSFLSLIFPLALARALTARPELAEQAAERSHLFSIKNAAANTTIDRVLNMVPEVISRFSKKKEKKEEVREAALKEAEQAMKEEKETAVLEAKADGKTEETK